MAERIQSWDALKQLRKKVQAEAIGKVEELVVAVGMATCGNAAGANEVYDIIRDGVEKNGLKHVTLMSTGCYGNCYAEPVVEVRQANMPAGSGIRYGYVDAARAKDIVERHLQKGELLEDAIVGQEVQIP